MPSKQDAFASNLENALGVALYNPVRLRDFSGRVGDIAFLHPHDGRYEWIRNAFDPAVSSLCFAKSDTDSKGLTEWGWPVHEANERTITQETPSHFRVAMGGNIRFEEKKAGVGADVPIAGAGYDFCKIERIYAEFPSRVNVGGEALVKVVKQGGSMSVLIPGQGALSYRACVEHEKARLICWFAQVEIRAWEWVNALYRDSDSRPNKIFLVTGQTLTPEFDIAHQEDHAMDCEILVEPKVGVPKIIEAHAILGYQFRKVSASLGFRSSGPASSDQPVLYSVFIETFDSKVLKRIKVAIGSTMFSRIKNTFLYPLGWFF
jgi:hypothetical protein